MSQLYFHFNKRQCLYDRQPVSQLKTLNGRQFGFIMKIKFYELKLTLNVLLSLKYSQAIPKPVLESENWFVVYARYTNLGPRLN